MPLSNLLKSAAGTCHFCQKKAGILRRIHSQCERTYSTGWNQMVHLAAQAAASRQFNEKALRRSLSAIALRSHGDKDTIARALEEGWRRGVRQAAEDGTITQEEETRLRDFRNRLALESNTADRQAYTQLDQASRNRLLSQARDAALTARDGDGKLEQLAKAMRDAKMDREAQFLLLRDAWETAIDTTLNSRLLTQDEEAALKRYISHFRLAPTALNRRGLRKGLLCTVSGAPRANQRNTLGVRPGRRYLWRFATGSSPDARPGRLLLCGTRRRLRNTILWTPWSLLLL